MGTTYVLLFNRHPGHGIVSSRFAFSPLSSNLLSSFQGDDVDDSRSSNSVKSPVESSLQRMGRLIGLHRRRVAFSVIRPSALASSTVVYVSFVAILLARRRCLWHYRHKYEIPSSGWKCEAQFGTDYAPEMGTWRRRRRGLGLSCVPRIKVFGFRVDQLSLLSLRNLPTGTRLVWGRIKRWYIHQRSCIDQIGHLKWIYISQACNGILRYAVTPPLTRYLPHLSAKAYNTQWACQCWNYDWPFWV